MRDILNAIVGRTLNGVTEARHWIDGVRGTGDDALMDCWLHFDDQPALHVCGDDTGTKLVVTFDEPYTSYDLGGRGEFRVEPALANDVLGQYVGWRLMAALPAGDGAALVLRFRADGSAVDGGAADSTTERDLFLACVDDDLVVRGVDVPPPTMGDRPRTSRTANRPA